LAVYASGNLADPVIEVFSGDLGRDNCPVEPHTPGDFDYDGDVDGLDIEIFINAYVSTDSEADLNGDDEVDWEDLKVFAIHYGESECP
jgi:hypothetical protein